MLKVNIELQGLEKLQNEINKLEKIIKIKNNNQFKSFLKSKVWQTLQDVMNTRITGGTTNDEEIDLYKSSNHMQDIDNGFILYNDATINVHEKLASKYPNGKFSVALAFEYGVGITGEGTYDKGTSTFVPWEYNVNNYNFGWTYTKNGEKHATYGYMGFEIYRYVAEEVNNKMNQWINEYLNGKVV